MKKIVKTYKPTSPLSERGEQIFYDLLSLLSDSIEIDAIQLTLLASYLDDYEKISELISKEANPYMNKHGQIHPLQTQRNKTIDVILKLGDRFGLNPKARGDSKTPSKEEKPFNPLDQFKK